MGGYPAIKQPRLTGREVARPRSNDPCDLEFRVDLVGVHTSVTRSLAVGDVLMVELRSHGEVASAVCVAQGERVAGTLAAFRGLAQLIGCIRAGAQYHAVVESASKTHCGVIVQRLAQ